MEESIDTLAQAPVEAEKIAQVETIVAADREAFEAWVSDPAHAMNLDMPEAALRYLLIPQRVLELADDPSAVNVLIISKTPKRLQAFVLEHKAESITDTNGLKTFLVQEQERRLKLQAEAQANGTPFIFIHNTPPGGVDEYHARHHELVEDRRLGLNDFVTNEVTLSVENNAKMSVDKYLDREVMRKRGVGKSFYTRLHNSATKLGFRFISGGNNKANVDFFTNVLGRVPLSRIKPEQRTIFFPNAGFNRALADMLTIDFLDPADKALFVEE